MQIIVNDVKNIFKLKVYDVKQKVTKVIIPGQICSNSFTISAHSFPPFLASARTVLVQV